MVNSGLSKERPSADRCCPSIRLRFITRGTSVSVSRYGWENKAADICSMASMIQNLALLPFLPRHVLHLLTEF